MIHAKKYKFFYKMFKNIDFIRVIDDIYDELYPCRISVTDLEKHLRILRPIPSDDEIVMI
jgi:hypothetical protein